MFKINNLDMKGSTKIIVGSLTTLGGAALTVVGQAVLAQGILDGVGFTDVLEEAKEVIEDAFEAGIIGE